MKKKEGFGKRFLRSIPMLLLPAVPYTLFVFMKIMLGEEWYSSDLKPERIIGIAAAAVYLLNLAYPFILAKLGAAGERLLFWNMLLKLINILFYIIMFIFGIGALFAFGGFLVLPLLVVYDYLMLLPTTMYGIAGAVRANKSGQISVLCLMVTIVLQFFFCLDVCSAIYLYAKVEKEANRLSESRQENTGKN